MQDVIETESTPTVPYWRSYYESQDDILRAILHLHCPEGFECDMTYGNGSFWKQIPRPAHCFDITPLHEGVIQADSRKLPLPDAFLLNAVFDPPFLTYVSNGRAHKGGNMAMSARFGGYYTYEELENHYYVTLKEAHRVLKPRGKFIFKCQDIVHNHQMHCTHALVIGMAESFGFKLLDLFILPAKHRMRGPQQGQQRHARIWHSYFLVFDRNRV